MDERTQLIITDKSQPQTVNQNFKQVTIDRCLIHTIKLLSFQNTEYMTSGIQYWASQVAQAQ